MVRKSLPLILIPVLWLALAAPAAEAGDGPRVGILVGSLDSYRTAGTALQAELEATGHDCVVIHLPHRKDPAGRRRAVQRLIDAEPTLIAATGQRATLLALDAVPGVPVVFLMVPNAEDALFLVEGSAHRKRVAGVAGDVTPGVWMQWIERLTPDLRTLGILYSESSKRTAGSLVASAREHGVRIVQIATRKDEFPQAADELTRSRCDAALMLADPTIYNAPNVQHLILWGARAKKPVWGFSANVVKAGALAGQYFNSEAIGIQAAEVVHRILNGENPETIGLLYAEKLDRSVNEHTAKLIGVRIGESVIGAETERFGGG